MFSSNVKFQPTFFFKLCEISMIKTIIRELGYLLSDLISSLLVLTIVLSSKIRTSRIRLEYYGI